MIGASFDTVEDLHQFAEAESYPYALISDVDRAIGRTYDAELPTDHVFYEFGMPRRISYLIDPDGLIAAAYDLEGEDLAAHAGVVLEDIVRLS